MKRLALQIFLCLVVGASLSSCQSSTKTEGLVEVAGRPVALDSYNFSAIPYSKCRVLLKGSPYEGMLKAAVKGDRTTFTLTVNGADFSQEKYITGPSLLRFEGTNQETYDPPLTLASAPLSAPDVSSWKGQIVVGEDRFDAEAEIRVTEENLNIKGGTFDALHFEVTMTFNGDQTRTLDFWTVPDKGIIKRDFNGSSTREPLE